MISVAVLAGVLRGHVLCVCSIHLLNVKKF